MRYGNISDRWKENEARRLKFIDRIKTMTKDQQHFRPAKGEYIALKVLEHMALLAIFCLPILKKHDPKLLHAMPAKPRFLFPFALQQLSNVKSIPTLSAMNPKITPTLEDAAEKWEDVRREIGRIIRNSPEDGTIIKHPIFGRLGAIQFIDLLDVHFMYHERRFPVQIS